MMLGLNMVVGLLCLASFAGGYDLHHTKKSQKHYKYDQNSVNNNHETNIDHDRANYNRVPNYRRGIPKKQAKTSNPAEMETARIIPAKFGGWRSNVKYDISKDIRRNLFFHYTFNKLEKRPTYCATFRITNSRRNCVAPYGTEWSKVLQRGQTICVECQQMAMHKDLGVRCRGHGVHRMETRWNAVKASGCHGKWEMIEYHKECSCGNGPSDFIFI